MKFLLLVLVVVLAGCEEDKTHVPGRVPHFENRNEVRKFGTPTPAVAIRYESRDERPHDVKCCIVGASADLHDKLVTALRCNLIQHGQKEWLIGKRNDGDDGNEFVLMNKEDWRSEQFKPEEFPAIVFYVDGWCCPIKGTTVDPVVLSKRFNMYLKYGINATKDEFERAMK